MKRKVSKSKFEKLVRKEIERVISNFCEGMGQDTETVDERMINIMTRSGIISLEEAKRRQSENRQNMYNAFYSILEKYHTVVDNKRILIVDDNAEVRETIEGMLIKDGYETETADDGVPALELLKKGVYDLILTDNVMKELYGMALSKLVFGEGQLLDAFKDDFFRGTESEYQGFVWVHKETPIILVATSLVGSEREFEQLQGKYPLDFVKKNLSNQAEPFDKDLLVEKIQKYLKE